MYMPHDGIADGKYHVKVILDSVSRGHRITTLQATFPRFILAEVNTHRMFSRNSASSRAIPVQKRIEQIRAEPFIPEAFCKNQAGMIAGVELSDEDSRRARNYWMRGVDQALSVADDLARIGVHKQWANRTIETYAWHTAVITATEWENHDALRAHPDASPEYQKIARLMKEGRAMSRPRKLDGPGSQWDQWHLPYVQNHEGDITLDDLETAESIPRYTTTQVLRMMSVGRCAAVSYERQEERNGAKDVERYQKLRASGHMSPFEHAARPMTGYEYNCLFAQRKLVWDDAINEWKWIGASEYRDGEYWHFCGNVQGWIQERKLIPNEENFDAYMGKSGDGNA